MRKLIAQALIVSGLLFAYWWISSPRWAFESEKTGLAAFGEDILRPPMLLQDPPKTPSQDDERQLSVSTTTEAKIRADALARATQVRRATTAIRASSIGDGSTVGEWLDKLPRSVKEASQGWVSKAFRDGLLVKHTLSYTGNDYTLSWCVSDAGFVEAQDGVTKHFMATGEL